MVQLNYLNNGSSHKNLKLGKFKIINVYLAYREAQY